MAWPFSNVTAPNLDSGIIDVPTSPTAVTASAAWLLGANLTNTGSVTRTVTITDTAGAQILASVDVPPGVAVPIEWAFLPTTGVKWSASGSGIKGKLWGYV